MNINISSVLTSLLLSLIISGCAIFGEPTEYDETLGRTDAEIIIAAEVFSAKSYRLSRKSRKKIP
jgi:hypothetical protein